MAIYSNKRAEDKAIRIAETWPKVKDEVFEALGVTRTQLERLEHQLVGSIVLPGMPDYDKDRQGNPLYPAYPQIIVYCVVFNDVRLCLEWAHTFDWWITCRSGGHSTAGYSVNSGMVIDVSEMKCVIVDPALKQARVGSGAQFHELDSVLNTYRLHVPGGGCPDVGIAGYMQGGGYGFTSREFGMNCDSVLEATLMLYDGRIVVANSSQNQDLFWAIRGGTGDNFGVLLEIKYQLYDLYEVWGFVLQWTIDEAPAALFEMQNNYMEVGASSKLGFQTCLATIGGNPGMVVLGMYHGSRSDGLEAIERIRATGHPSLVFDKTGPYAELNDAILLSVLTPPRSDLIEFKNSGYVASPLQISDWERVTDYFARTPNKYNLVGMEAYGGAINAFPSEDSAFIHRDVYMNFFVDSFFAEQGDFTSEKQAKEWLEGFMDLMRPCLNGHVYQNYPVRDFPNFRWAYWGDAYNTLMFVKTKYDPNNFFHFEQSISPYPENDTTIRRSTQPSIFDDPKIAYEPYVTSFLDKGS